MGYRWRTAASPAPHLTQVKWSSLALDDLEAIRAYIARENPDAAARVSIRLMDAGDGLETFPDRGRPRDDGRRELTAVWRYVIIYRRVNNGVAILRVRHGARDE